MLAATGSPVVFLGRLIQDTTSWSTQGERVSQLMGALIGVFGTLAGGSVAGAFTVLKARQESSDRERDRLEQRLGRQHEVRQGAYAGFLCACHKADDKFMAAWAAPLGGEREAELLTAVVAAREAARSIREYQVIVGLAGPNNLADLTDQLCRKYAAELAVIEDLGRAHAADPGCVEDHQTPEQRREVEARWDIHDRIVAEGRAVLGGDLPPDYHSLRSDQRAAPTIA
ncbi:hypothetical protein J7E88_08635 [Streptomyces sp. ISL-10]|uniref:hypothetical protein n=1 Tax=Streptomyces sp. ISL-10 TaxID=2819172 RepID=UPI001BEA84EA|nr:hypothetical protein [Streptomyces sp. ISL-10]MBT2365388.1 hypothetical protein [Streptomyces sp. ISL-10]